jgi:predicted amidohydrolase
MTRIAIAQITSSTNKQENLALANQLITEAKGKSARDRLPGISHVLLAD